MARGQPLVHDEMFLSYAQNFEDVMLWRALGYVEHGFYVDIGAQHPRVDSVSRAFHEHGWRGVHVEPSDEYAKLLREDRPDDDVLQMAIAERDGVVEFFDIPQTGLSTIDSDVAAGHADAGYAPQRTVVPCMTLDRLLERYADRDVHWLKIDVEGAERRVLQGWIHAAARPWIVVVESTRPLSQQATAAEWEPGLVALGYEHVYSDGLNRFYVSRAHPELREAFAYPPNVFDDFELSGSSSFGLGWQRRMHELEASHAASTAALQEREAALRLEVQRAQVKMAADARAIAERDRLRQAVELIAEQRKQHIAGLEAALREHAARYEALEAFNRQVESLYASVVASRSWRLTQPLRWIANECRRLVKGGMPNVEAALPSPKPSLRGVLRRGVAYVDADPRRRRTIARAVRPIRPLDAWLRNFAARHAAPRGAANAIPSVGTAAIERDDDAQILARRLAYITELETRIDEMARSHRREIERLHHFTVESEDGA